LLLVSSLVHFNAAPFLVGGGLYAWLNRDHLRPLHSYRISAIGGALVVIASWLAYGLYVRTHWQSFVHDMGFQYARKMGRTLMPSVLTLENSVLAALVITVIIVAIRKPGHLRVTHLLALAIPAWLVAVTGLEMWYDIFRAIAFLCLSVIAFRLADLVIRTINPELGQRPLRAIQTWVVFVILGALFLDGRVNSPIDYKRQFQWQGMYLRVDVPYLTLTDKEAVTGAIDHGINGLVSPTIRFFPRADALLFYDDLEKPVAVSDPIFEEQHVDLSILHVSRHFPSWWRFRVADELKRLHVDSLARLTPFYSRDATERWYLIKN